jgi:hypothetical protein
MAIPQAPPFEELLSSIRLVESMPMKGDSRRLPAVPARDETGRIMSDRPLWLTYNGEAALGFDSLVTKVAKELASRGHPATEELALFTLALAFLVPAPTSKAVDRLNRLLGRTKRADVSLYLWFPFRLPGQFAMAIPPFYIGPTRTDKLKYQCERAGSDYYARYASLLKQTSSIERSPKNVTILDIEYAQTRLFDDAFNIDAQGLLPRVAAVLDGYFGFLNGVLFEDFLPEFIASQDVTVSLGAPFVDPESMLGIVGFQQVAIFMNFGKHGFVAPRGPGIIQVDLANAHVRVPQALQELEGRFGYHGTENAPFYQTLKLYCSFVARAKRHLIAGRLDEALLHAVIAMELVFADRATPLRSFVERVAVLTHESFGRTFLDQRTWIDGIYDTRSRYVHAGHSNVQESQLEDLFELCKLLTRRMLRAAAASGDKPDALAAWLAELDYLAKAYLASKTPSASDLAAAYLGADWDDALDAERSPKH